MLTAAMIRGLRGATAQILLLFLVQPGGGNQAWVERFTGCTDKTVSKSLDYLVEIGLVVRTGQRGDNDYRLAGGAINLPLPLELLGENAAETEPSPAEDESESENLRLDPLESRSLTTSSSQESESDSSLESEPEKFRLEILAAAGIREPALSEIASDARISTREIQYHLQNAPGPGAVVWRCLHGWKVPRDWRPEQIKPEIPWYAPAAEIIEPELLTTIPRHILDTWTNAMRLLAEEVPRSQFDTWLRPAWAAGMGADGALVVGVCNGSGSAWLENHVKRRLEELTGQHIRFEIRQQE
jgi:hypothetical protein